MDTLRRREFLMGTAALGTAVTTGAFGVTPAASAAEAKALKSAEYPMPGPFKGKVVEAVHPGAVVNGSVNADAVTEMVHRGMLGLTGEKDWASAWRRFFVKGDVVAIKVNPVGQPLAISQHPTVLAIIDGLRQAGLPPQDIIVYDRYRRQLLRAGYREILPEGVRWDAAAEDYDDVQLGIEGYDPDVFVEMPLIAKRHHDPDDPRARRSHLALVVSKKVNKIINVPVLKDHGTGGVTLALKNMSHGFVNNVARSHDGPFLNACGQFIPAIVSFPVIRSKVVLHILDGIRAVYEGGPSARARNTWEQKTLWFATDPVAMDRVGLEVVDAKRKEKGLTPVGETKWMGGNYRQPEHIIFASALGLGVSDRDKIDLAKISLG
jgi:Domain of unknown function (DUF362)